MVAITILGVLFYTHAILLHPANFMVIPNEEVDTFKTLCSTNCQDLGNRNDSQDFPLYKCSCSPGCATYGDCCYDSPYRNETTLERINSICVSIFGRGQYRVISGCPDNKLSDFCHDSIGHLPPVTSKMTNTTYANMFCAICNEDGNDVTTWNVKLKCSEDEKDVIGADEDDSMVIIYQSNHLWRMSESTRTKSLCTFHVHSNNFSLIDGLELRTCDDEKPILDCSSSWGDIEVMRLCRSYEDPVYFGSKLFRNSHCAQCNYMAPKFARCMPFDIEVTKQMGLVDPSVTRFCKNRGSNACTNLLSVTGTWSSNPFSMLMNLPELTCIPNPGRRCCTGERYDFRSKRCRKVSRKV